MGKLLLNFKWVAKKKRITIGSFARKRIGIDTWRLYTSSDFWMLHKWIKCETFSRFKFHCVLLFNVHILNESEQIVGISIVCLLMKESLLEQNKMSCIEYVKKKEIIIFNTYACALLTRITGIKLTDQLVALLVDFEKALLAEHQKLVCTCNSSVCPTWENEWRPLILQHNALPTQSIKSVVFFFFSTFHCF